MATHASIDLAGLGAGAERRFEDARRRQAERLAPRQRRAELVCGAAFVAVTVLLVLLAGHARPLHLGTAILLALGLAVLARVEIAIGSGFAVPTQLMVVPMLFLLPVGVVPVVVACGMVLSRAVDVARARQHPERLLLGLADSWFAVGPAVVLAAAGVVGVSWADWPWWVLALGAQLATDVSASWVREWLHVGTAPGTHLSEFGVVALVDASLAPVGLLAAEVGATHVGALLFTLPLVAIVDALARERRSRIEQTVELSHAYQGTALLLGEAIESDDHYTGEHSRGVVALATDIADELRLGEHERRLVEFAALLHDVGKLAVPNEIINKPGPLDDREWEIMRHHTIDGQEMLARVGGLMQEVGVVVRASHERWDGTGYPDGLAGEGIPMAARIVCCADAYSAMTTDRSYRRALGVDQAVEELRANAGAQFDPRVVDAAIAVLGRLPAPEPEPLLVARAVAAGVGA
jgi:putative nucleotidyltransferase with HDIG domain